MSNHCPDCYFLGGLAGTVCNHCHRGIVTLTEEPTPWAPDSHWSDHPDYPASDWRVEVENSDTRQSYVEWVNSQLEQQL